MVTVTQPTENVNVILDSLDQVVSNLVHLENMDSIAHWIVSVKDKLVVIQFKGAVIVHQGDTVAGANSRVPMVSTDGIAPSHAPAKTVHIVMEQMGGACAQQASRGINVNKSVQKGLSVRHVVNLAIVGNSNVTRRMGSVFVRLEDMDPCVKRSVELEDMERHVITSVNVSMERPVIRRPVNVVALQAGLVQHAKWKCLIPTTSQIVETFQKTGNGG